MAERIDALLIKYEKRFHEDFPLMLCRGMSDEDICEIVQNCLDKNEAFSPDPDSDADY